MNAYQRNQIIESVLLYTDCKTEDCANTYIDNMYADGMTFDDIYNYFVINSPA